MNKREKYNRRAIAKYHRHKFFKSFGINAFLLFGEIAFLFSIAEPYGLIPVAEIICRMVLSFFISVVFLYIAKRISKIEIKEPTITHKQLLVDRSKDMAELALKYEVIPKPKK